MAKTHEYELLPGTVLTDPINKNFDLLLVPQKLMQEGGEDLALYHLAFNPVAPQYFVRTPEDVEKRIKEFLSRQDNKIVSFAREESSRKKEILTVKIAQAKAVYYSAKQAALEAHDALKALEAEYEAADRIPDIKEPEKAKETKVAPAPKKAPAKKTEEAPKPEPEKVEVAPVPELQLDEAAKE